MPSREFIELPVSQDSNTYPLYKNIFWLKLKFRKININELITYLHFYWGII